MKRKIKREEFIVCETPFEQQLQYNNVKVKKERRVPKRKRHSSVKLVDLTLEDDIGCSVNQRVDKQHVDYSVHMDENRINVLKNEIQKKVQQKLSERRNIGKDQVKQIVVKDTQSIEDGEFRKIVIQDTQPSESESQPSLELNKILKNHKPKIIKNTPESLQLEQRIIQDTPPSASSSESIKPPSQLQTNQKIIKATPQSSSSNEEQSKSQPIETNQNKEKPFDPEEILTPEKSSQESPTKQIPEPPIYDNTQPYISPNEENQADQESLDLYEFSQEDEEHHPPDREEVVPAPAPKPARIETTKLKPTSKSKRKRLNSLEDSSDSDFNFNLSPIRLGTSLIQQKNGNGHRIIELSNSTLSQDKLNKGLLTYVAPTPLSSSAEIFFL